MNQQADHKSKPAQPTLRGGQTRFVDAGSLPVPRWYGRLLRLLLGVAILFWLIPSLIAVLPALRQTTAVPTSLSFWVIVLIALANVNHVVNLGLGRSWGRGAQIVSLTLLGGLALVSFVQTGNGWGPPVSIGLFTWLLAVYLPLGVPLCWLRFCQLPAARCAASITWWPG